MSFNWLLYLEVADKLTVLPDRGLEEAYLRSAVSRYYYGVFCRSREILENKGYVFPKRNVHQKVIDALKSEEASAGVNLDRLRRERNQADYDETVRFTRIRVQKARHFTNLVKRWIDQRYMQ